MHVLRSRGVDASSNPALLIGPKYDPGPFNADASKGASNNDNERPLDLLLGGAVLYPQLGTATRAV
eukprot:12935239-Alexandrium_andersonii.AAC.1